MSAMKGLEWTFDTAAKLYEKMRPGYPDELYGMIKDYIPLDGSSSAVEVGIGGGQATEPILKTGCSVLAVEYGSGFTRLCREKFGRYEGFAVLNGRFEKYFPYSERAEPSQDLQTIPAATGAIRSSGKIYRKPMTDIITRITTRSALSSRSIPGNRRQRGRISLQNTALRISGMRCLTEQEHSPQSSTACCSGPIPTISLWRKA